MVGTKLTKGRGVLKAFSTVDRGVNAPDSVSISLVGKYGTVEE